ncbi:MAG: hypothetical protein CVV64_11935 [Candidatus Wallbacteria bacterium HGW-Wallbacteria-1]|jgi:hypothetical protein|uniref:site-specific DNA-methyltransferase (adenine-specific) n=1 Tax=Candidatus Wallbacteria bacterium HGW-Wallbacteria-1 TaxID=2013854 RepID=A0A2N1PNW9_9BACT|nr:MAG: hypothetical protein CVV64_11935 [Candidatus Wallbacteria bacterium HGW-Wallbacteria-1]
MNKSALKKFAVEARNMLMEQVAARAAIFGIAKKEIAPVQSESADAMVINGMVHDLRIKKQRNDLIRQVQSKGFDQVMEEAAYTWFNRFMALRFMEVNDYLPTGTRVLSSIVPDRDEPDLLVNCLKIDLPIDKETVYTFQDKSDREGLYRYLLTLQCNELNSILPFMFEPIRDYTELLLPDNLLYSESVIRKMARAIPEEDWQEVEIIGWLYQYYISEKKDQVFKDLAKNKKITKENIPAATQLFTPKWIVQYMVENSVGKLWLESRPDKELQSKWRYYLEPSEQDHEVQARMNEAKNPNLSPEDITVLDPCMGSGHMLVYAFEILFDVYRRAGYSDRDIGRHIIEKNLYGLDIDDRAAQLASFALVMKARQYDRRIFREPLRLNLCSIKPIGKLQKERLDDYPELKKVYEAFKDAKTIGSLADIGIINVNKAKNEYQTFRDEDVMSMSLNVDLDNLWKQTEILLGQKYDVVITNPPYMGGKGMTPDLSDFVKKTYPDSKGDLFAVFIEKCMALTKDNHFTSMITQHAWMFLSSYEKLRNKVITDSIIDTMVHLGPRAFEEIGGEVVQTTAFVLRG